jgi:hypothetical protein
VLYLPDWNNFVPYPKHIGVVVLVVAHHPVNGVVLVFELGAFAIPIFGFVKAIHHVTKPFFFLWFYVKPKGVLLVRDSVAYFLLARYGVLLPTTEAKGNEDARQLKADRVEIVCHGYISL